MVKYPESVDSESPGGKFIPLETLSYNILYFGEISQFYARRFHMKTLKILGIFIIVLLVTFSVSYAGQLYGVRLFSDARQYDPSHFSFDESSVYYNGNIYWFMYTWAHTSGDPPRDPVYFDSPVYSDLSSDDPIQLDYRPSYYPTGPDFHTMPFFDFDDFAPPGGDWENKTYRFYLDTNKNGEEDSGEPVRVWPIPSGSLRQLEIPQNVTISGGIHPTISWDPVTFITDGGYMVNFYSLTSSGFPDFSVRLGTSLYLTDTFYTYTGDIFEDGKRYAVWVQAREDHPWAIPGSIPGDVLINRSGIFTTYQAFVSEIEDFCEETAATGDLEGAGPGSSADGRFNALMNMIAMAGDLIHDGDIDGACDQLMAAYKKCDGDPHPPDFVEGPAASDLAGMIIDLMDQYECF